MEAILKTYWIRQMGRRADRNRKAAGLPKQVYDPHWMIARCQAELTQNPYDARVINSLRNSYQKTGQGEQLDQILAHTQAISESNRNHSWDDLDIEDVRPVFSQYLYSENYEGASDILVRMGRNPKRNPNEIESLLDDAKRISPLVIGKLIKILSPTDITYDVGVLCALGYAHKSGGDETNAVRILKQGINLYRAHEPIRYALQELTPRKSPRLLREARALLKLDPQNIEYANILAAGYLRFSLPIYAIRTLEPFCQSSEANQQATHLLALGYIRNNNFKSADRVLAHSPE
ncbi:MAG: tetratricopeptide repeat protein, partial [Bdellovibrionales bacterium]